MIDLAGLERRAVEQLPALKAKAEAATSARTKLALLLRIAVLEELVRHRQPR